MRVLHISNDFAGSTVHRCLYSELDKLGVEQLIYCPVRDSQLIGKNKFEGDNSVIEYANIIKSYYKYLYHIKQRRLYNHIKNKYDLSKYALCHASNLLSDGGIAYRIYKEYHIPYLVAVRRTDLDVFLKKMPHTWRDAKIILQNAKKIVFINKGMVNDLEKHVAIKPILHVIREKYTFQSNGIDDFYLDHWHNKKHIGYGIIYIGDFTRRKNVLRLCQSVLKLKEKYPDVKLTLVGGGKGRNGASEDVEETEKLIWMYPETFNYVGPVYDKKDLCKILNDNTIFAMPSIHETFGLVYIEALSQNLALLYTKGQGIDGLFDTKVGIAVDPFSSNNILKALETLLEDRDNYSNANLDPESFRWSNIANMYLNYYNEILK